MQDQIKAITAPLIQWFEKNKRMLPWRQDNEPYHVWISEIMLQQTRIEAVLGYYARFTAALPDVAALSRADDDALLKLWEGLGYYSRARNLKKAAVTIMTDYNGVFPRSFTELRKLAGIGDYTAGAIASICFNEPVPAVDGNVLRVISRVTGSRENVLLPAVKKCVTAALSAVMPEQSGVFNEALMELGETLCTPNGMPGCTNCPIQSHCTAFREGLTTELPVRIKQQKRRKTEKTVLLLVSGDGDIAIEKRREKGLLSGMYQLPNADQYYSEKELKEWLNAWEITPQAIEPLGNVKHAFTHVDWLMKGYKVTTENKSSRFLWVKPQELRETYPLPTAFRKFTNSLLSLLD